MAQVSQVVSNIETIATTAYMTIQPATGEEWIIHNIYFQAAVTVEFFDGSRSIDFDVRTARGVLAGMQFHLTPTRWIRVQNNDVASKNIGYDGVRTA